MTLGLIPPVRARVPVLGDEVSTGRQRIEAIFPGQQIALYGSGTQALAVAIARAIAKRGGGATEVIIPAYACPDLVTACVFAGAHPRLVDVAPEGWGYDKARLAESFGPRTAAVVAVNLLGLGDDTAGIQPLIAGSGITLIHDSAQYMPESPMAWRGPVVLSFGRGKPVNMLYGGALVDAVPSQAEKLQPDGRGWLSTPLGPVAFNLLTQPLLYGVMSRLPGLHVGETEYKTLEALTEPGETLWRRLGPALLSYAQPRPATDLWRQAVSGWDEFGIAPVQSELRTTRMLRFPILARDRDHRDRLVSRLTAEGIGASPMYATALPAAKNLPPVAAGQGPFPNAERFASRLFTVPTHAQVTGDVVARADRCIRAVKV